MLPCNTWGCPNHSVTLILHGCTVFNYTHAVTIASKYPHCNTKVYPRAGKLTYS